MTTDMKATSDDNQKKIEIKNILVPIDGSEYSLNAAQYAARIARDEKAQLFCIHIVIPPIPYGYAAAAFSVNSQYYDGIKQKVQSWFDNVVNMAEDEGIPEVKTEILFDVKSVIESILDYETF